MGVNYDAEIEGKSDYTGKFISATDNSKCFTENIKSIKKRFKRNTKLHKKTSGEIKDR